MKSKIIFLALTFLAVAQSIAQTFTFPLQKGNIWQYKEPPPPPYDYDLIEARVMTDTLMSNGHSYTLISWYNYGYANAIWNHYYRQASDTVYEYLPNAVNGGMTNEVIRYNFAKALGDTVTSYATGGDTIVTTVIDQGTMSVSGTPTSFKTYYIGYKHSTMFWMDKITDGIGLMYEEIEAGFELSLVGSIINGDSLGTILGVHVTPSTIAHAYDLSQNYPNPFNPSTTIQYTIPDQQFVRVLIFDVLGRLVATLVNNVQSAGSHSITWVANHSPSGVYFCRLETSKFTATRKLLLQK